MIPQKRSTIFLTTLTLIFSLLLGSVVSAQSNQQQSNFQAPIVVINTSFLNVRVGPGVQYAVLVTVVGGTELTVLGAAGDDVWYQVATDAGVGWLNVTFTLPRGDFRNVPLIRYTPEASALGQGGGGVVPQGSGSTASSVIPKEGVAILASDMRQEPSDSALAIRRALPNDPNTIYPIQSIANNSEGTWYLVNVPGVGQGWVNKVELRLLKCGALDVVTLTREEPFRFAAGSYLIPPGTEAFFIEQRGEFGVIELLGGDRGEVLMDSVASRTGVTSLCADLPNVATPVSMSQLGQGGGIAPSPAQAISGNRVIINTGNLNVRSGPAVGFAPVAVVPGGTELAVLGRATDNVWLFVQGSFGQGWLNSEFTIFRGSYSTIPVIRDTSEFIIPAPNTFTPSVSIGQGGGSATPMTSQPMSGNRVIVNTGNLNIRSGPAVGFAQLAVVPGGTELIVLGRASDNVWLFVEGAFGQGWLNSELTIFRGDYSTVPVIRDTSLFIIPASNVTTLGQDGGVAPSSAIPKEGVAVLASNFLQEPSNSALAIRRTLSNDPNTIYPIQAIVTNSEDTWYFITIPGIGQGWVNKVELRLLECSTLDVVTLNRDEPLRFDGISNRDAYLLPAGTEAFFIEQRDNSGLIELLGGDRGFVSLDSVGSRPDNVVSLCDNLPIVTSSGATVSTVTSSSQPTTLAVSGNRAIVNTGNLNVRSGPSAGFAAVITVPGGTELAVTGRTPDGVWYRVQGTFGEGWVNSEFTIFRGSYGTIPVVSY